MENYYYILLLAAVSCSIGLKMVTYGEPSRAPLDELYVNGMNGVENLAFDKKGFLYATGLDGMIYKF